MKIAIACDHAGYEYKEKLVAFLRQKGYEVKDFGTHSAESIPILPIRWLLLLNPASSREESRSVGVGMGFV